MVRKAPPVAEVMHEVVAFVGDCPLVAHNATFDRKFLVAELDHAHIHRHQEFACSMHGTEPSAGLVGFIAHPYTQLIWR